MSSAIGAAVLGAVSNNPAAAADIVNAQSAGALISATDPARQSLSMPLAAGPVTYGSGGPGTGYATALANTDAAAQENLMTLASQNQLLETLMSSM